jgi:glutathione S-transferase
MLQVIGKAASINVRKVLWTCMEASIEHELVAPGPDLLSLNPNGLVPAIRDDGFVLWESNSICRYLAAHHRRTDLLPTAVRDRALVEQWMDWQATDLNFAWRYAFLSLVRHSPLHRDAAAVAASVDAWNAQMRILDARLAATAAHVAGAGFSLADVVVGLSVHRWFMTPIERPRLAAVESYYERLTERPAFCVHGRNGLP